MRSKNISLETIIVRGVFILTLIPLLVVPWSLFPFVAPRGFFFLITGSVIIASAVLWCLHKRCTLRFPVFFIFLSLYVFWMLIVSLIGAHPLYSIFPSYERMGGWLMLGILYGVFAVSTLPFFSGATWKRLYILSLSIGGIIAATALTETLIEFPNSYPNAFFGNPTILASFLVLQPFLALHAFIRTRTDTAKYALAALALISTIIVILSGARGAFLGIIAGLGWVGFFYFFYRNFFTRRRIVRICITLAVALGAAGLIFFATPVGSLVSDTFSQEITSLSKEPRLVLWAVALDGFLERPLLGRGYQSFDVVFEQKYRQPLIAQEAWFDSAHNTYLDILVDGGMPALALYLLFFASLLYVIHRRIARISRQSEKEVDSALFLTGGIVAYLVNNFFIFQSLVPTLIVFSTAAYLLLDSFAWRTAESPRRVRVDSPARFAFSILFGGMALIVILASFSSFAAGSIAANGLNANSSPEEKAASFRTALSLPTFDPRGLAIAIADGSAILGLKSDTVAPFDVSQAPSRPGDSRTLFAEGVYFLTRGNVAPATLSLEKARALAPRNPRIQSALGEAHTVHEKYDRAREAHREAYLLALELPATTEFQFYVDRAQERYAASLVYDGRQRAAERLLAKRYGGTFIPYTPQLLAAYDAQENGPRVFSLLQAAQAQEPNNPQYCFSFAAAQLKYGGQASAISALRTCAEKFPDVRADAEAFIRSIEAGTINPHGL